MNIKSHGGGGRYLRRGPRCRRLAAVWLVAVGSAWTQAVWSDALLAEWIELARDHSPRVAAGAYAVAEATAAEQAAGAARWPVITAQAAYRAHEDPQLLAPLNNIGGPSAFSDEIASADLVAAWPLYAGGRIKAGRDAARARLDSSTARQRRLEDQLALDVTRLYYRLAAQHQVILAAVFARDTMKEHAGRTDRLIEEGRAVRGDRLRVDVRVADLEQRLTDEEVTRDELFVAVATVIGLPDLFAPNGRYPGGPSMTLPSGTQDVQEPDMKAVIASRPDLHAMRYAVYEQEAVVTASRGTRMPTLSVQASVGRRWGVGDTIINNGGEEEQDVGVAGLVAELPLFEGGRARAVVAAARARLDALREQMRASELAARAEVRSAGLRVNALRKQVQVAVAAVDQARESLRLELARHELGRGVLIDVLDAQTALLEMETRHAHALAGYHIALAEWRFAIGESP